jgi:hypothetical protein
MVIEGRTIKNLLDLEDFCTAVRHATNNHPVYVQFDRPQDMQLRLTVLSDGRKIYAIHNRPWEY